MKTTEELIAYYEKDITRTERYIAFLKAHAEKIAQVGVTPSFWGEDHCDFDNITRPQVLNLIKAFPGTWDKTTSWNNEGIDYTLSEKVSEFTVRGYNGEPPPACKIEETVEYKLVPERLERVVKRKIVCPERAEVEAHSVPEPKVSEPPVSHSQNIGNPSLE